MTDKTPPQDRARIEYAARLLRFAQPRLSTKTDLTKKQIMVYAATLLNECAAREWPLPDALNLLILELLLDVSTKSPGSPVYPEKPEDYKEFGKMADLLRTGFEMALSRGNVVGEKNYWAAVEFEASRPDDISGSEPSNATVSAVATNSGAARDTIRRWRKNPTYRENVRLRRARNS